MMHKSRTLIFAGGGTAGHIEPALAVARGWQAVHPEDQFLFLGTAHGLENSLVPAANFPLHIIPKVVLPRGLSWQLLALPFRFARSVATTRRIISGADLLIGFGGYVAAPAYLAARLAKIPIVIHEANAKVGWANKLGALMTGHLAVAHEIASGRFAKARRTGLPLRPSILTAAAQLALLGTTARQAAKSQMGWSSEQPTLLVLGGSQGSAFMNREIATVIPELSARGVQILHSVGAKNEIPSETSHYRAVSYIDDMAQAYLAADVLLARSGAVTCAEFGALGRFAIFVPLSIGNGEQARNADFLVSAGRALVVPQEDFSAQWLLDHWDEIVARASALPPGGLDRDLRAVEEIVDLMQATLRIGKE